MLAASPAILQVELVVTLITPFFSLITLRLATPRFTATLLHANACSRMLLSVFTSHCDLDSFAQAIVRQQPTTSFVRHGADPRAILVLCSDARGLHIPAFRAASPPVRQSESASAFPFAGCRFQRSQSLLTAHRRLQLHRLPFEDKIVRRQKQAQNRICLSLQASPGFRASPDSPSRHHTVPWLPTLGGCTSSLPALPFVVPLSVSARSARPARPALPSPPSPARTTSLIPRRSPLVGTIAYIHPSSSSSSKGITNFKQASPHLRRIQQSNQFALLACAIAVVQVLLAVLSASRQSRSRPNGTSYFRSPLLLPAIRDIKLLVHRRPSIRP